jgi:hypothetical protein
MDHNRLDSRGVQRHWRVTPTQFKWISHSLRKGAASAAACIGAPLTTIRYMGGWSKTDAVTGKYIDPTMSETPATWAFFGWLVAKPPD